jgi:hypothetical protein
VEITQQKENVLTEQAISVPIRTRESLLEELRKPSEPWVPVKETAQPREILGRVSDVYTTTSDYADSSGTYPSIPVVCIETGDVEYVVKGYAGMLRGKLTRLNPGIGDLVGIAYLGQPDPNDSKSPHRFNVRVFERSAAGSGDGKAEPVAEPQAERQSSSLGADNDVPF